MLKDRAEEAGSYVYIFGFKRGGSADGVPAQIDMRDYAAPCAAGGRGLIKVA